MEADPKTWAQHHLGLSISNALTGHIHRAFTRLNNPSSKSYYIQRRQRQQSTSPNRNPSPRPPPIAPNATIVIRPDDIQTDQSIHHQQHPASLRRQWNLRHHLIRRTMPPSLLLMQIIVRSTVICLVVDRS